MEGKGLSSGNAREIAENCMRAVSEQETEY